MISFRDKFSGNQAEKQEKNEKKTEKKNKKNEPEILPVEKQAEHFSKNIRLKVAKVVKIERNPDSDKLYIEHVDDGSGTDRVIQSGLVPYLKEDEILGKNVIIADNLAPRKMRGVESRGMLLAADYKKPDGTDGVELLEAPWAEPGTEIALEGVENSSSKPENIDASLFFQVEIKVKDRKVQIAGKNLLASGKEITAEMTENGEVH